MALATKFTMPMSYFGAYKSGSWAGYYFKEPLEYTSGVHTGVDFNGEGAGNVDLGLPIQSVANGIVRYTGNNTSIGFGNTTIIEHPLGAVLRRKLDCDSLFSRYMHQQQMDVSVGQEVDLGTTIGTVGNTGTRYAHLHLDLYKNTIDGGGVHLRYDKDTQLLSYLDGYEFILDHTKETEPSLEPYQRVVGPNGVNHRTAPNTGAPIAKEWQPEEILDLRGYVIGESVSGNDIWFVGRYDGTVKGGGALWSGAFTDPTPRGLPDLTPSPSPSPTPDPQPNPDPVPVIMFPPDTSLVDRVVGSPNYVDVDQEPKFIVIHQWDSPDKYPTQQGVINTFLTEDGISAHYVVNDHEVVQMVPEKKRAQHAGPQGNDGIGIEFDPNGGDAMYARGQALVADIRRRLDNLELKRHSDFMNTECPKYISIERLEQAPATEEPTTGPTDKDKEQDARLTVIEGLLQNITGFLSEVFNKFKRG